MAGQGSGPSRTTNGRRTVSPAVYRRRRLVVGVLALLIIVGLVFGAVAVIKMFAGGNAEADGATTAPGQTTPAQAGQDSKAATESQPASPTPTPQSGCADSKVVVEASTDKSVYQAGAKPVLTLSVSNKGEKPCEVNVGTSQMEFLVTSGDDRVFSSRDCQAEPSDLVRTIEPGKSEKANFMWERNRTTPGCNPVEMNPKPGYYVLVTKLGERVSDKTSFELR